MLLSATSCSDYLSEINPNKTTVETFWQNLDDTQSGLIAMYASLRNDYVWGIKEESWRCDEFWPGYGRPVPQNNAEGYSWYSQLYTNSTDGIKSRWDAQYITIWRANQVIDALNSLKDEMSSDKDKTKWEYQMGQARFVRGLMYFYLYNAFNQGSVIIRRHTEEDTNLPLSTPEEVFDFYTEDLQAAYELLPSTTEEGGSNYVGMPIKGTAETIQGISYLYHHDYKGAKEKFASVMKNYSYSLETDWQKMFTTAGEHNSESILEVEYSLDYRQDITTWDPNCMYNRLATLSTNQAGFLPAAWLIYEYNQDMPDPLDARNEGRQVSLRASAMVALVNDYVTPYYISGNAAQNGQFGGTSGAWGFGKLKKYTNHDIVDKEKTSMSGKNIVINRLSDVYLMYAECLLNDETPDIQGALDYINEVRARWGVVLLGKTGKYASSRTYNGQEYTKETLMNHLMFVERPLELCGEGNQIRWQDLKRWGLLEDNDKNIFKYRASISPKFYTDKTTTLKTLDGKDLKFKYNAIVTTQKTSTSSSLDYEFKISARNYSKDRNLYFPIPQSEIMNNSSIK